MLRLNTVWLSICSIAILIGSVHLLVIVLIIRFILVNKRKYFVCLVFPLMIVSSFREVAYQKYLANKPDITHAGKVIEVAETLFQQVIIVNLGEARILANLAKYPQIRPDSIVKVSGNLIQLDIENKFEKNSVINGIGWKIDNAEVKIIEVGIEPKDYCDLLKPVYAYELGQFLCGITIGQYQLKEENEDLFKGLGISHVLSVSGYNVTLLMSLLLKLSGRINRRKLYLVIPLLLFGYLQIVGTDNIPAARAVVMAIVTILATATGRPAAIWLAILYTNLLFFWINPLVYLSISWQLSLSALVGILLLTDSITKALKFIPMFIRGELAVSLAASLATAPVLLLNFGELSWISPVANLIILPMIPYAMLLAGIVIIAGFIEPLRIILFFWSELVWRLLLKILIVVNSYKLEVMTLFLVLIIGSYAYFKYTQKAK